MSKYLRLMLARDSMGETAVVTAPSHILVSAGDLVSINGSKMLTVEKETITAADSDEMDMLKAVTTVHEVIAVYHKKWSKEEEDGETS